MAEWGYWAQLQCVRFFLSLPFHQYRKLAVLLYFFAIAATFEQERRACHRAFQAAKSMAFFGLRPNCRWQHAFIALKPNYFHPAGLL